MVNNIFRGQIKLQYDLYNCSFFVCPFVDSIKLFEYKPKQLVIRTKNKFTCIIFSSGSIRFMGNCNLDSCNEFLKFIDFLYTDIITPIFKVSETIYINTYKHINLHIFAKNHCSKLITFEPELFSAISIHKWNPIHVNIFHNGKIIVLGKNASLFVSEIVDYVNKRI